VSPKLALNVWTSLGSRFLLEAELLQSPEWCDALTSVRPRLRVARSCYGRAATEIGLARIPATLEDASLPEGRSSNARVIRGDALSCSPQAGQHGIPKSVMHFEETLIYAARRFGEATGFSGADVYVAFGPYGHASGSLFDYTCRCYSVRRFFPTHAGRPGP